MPEQLLPDAFQPLDSWKILGFDPFLLMVLAFTVVPLVLAILARTAGALARLIQGSSFDKSVARRLARSRFAVLQRQPAGRLVRLEFAAPRQKLNTAFPFRRLRTPRLPRRHRGGNSRPSCQDVHGKRLT